MKDEIPDEDDRNVLEAFKSVVTLAKANVFFVLLRKEEISFVFPLLKYEIRTITRTTDLNL